MRYFSFDWIKTLNGKVVNRGTSAYYSEDYPKANDMKNHIPKTLNDDELTISIPLISEISRETYLSIGGNPDK